MDPSTRFPVRLGAKNGSPVPGYQGLIVTGRCGDIDKSRSVPFEKPMGKGTASTYYKGLFFEEATWDGSDIFRPAGTGFVFVTQKVKDVLSKMGATNFRFESLAEFERAALW